MCKGQRNRQEMARFVVYYAGAYLVHGLAEHLNNRRSSEIQGSALGKSLRAWTCIYRSMSAGVAQSRHAFVGGTVSTWGR